MRKRTTEMWFEMSEIGLEVEENRDEKILSQREGCLDSRVRSRCVSEPEKANVQFVLFDQERRETGPT